MKLSVYGAVAGTLGLLWSNAASAEIPASMYQGRDAIRVQFDGIDNQGTGAHVSDATVWKSLVSSHTLNIYTERANFADADNALTCIDRDKGIAAIAPSYWSGTDVTGDLTIEAVFNSAKFGSTTVLWSPQHYQWSRHFYFASDGHVAYQSNASSPTTDNGWGLGARSLTAVFDPIKIVERSYTNGLPATMTSKAYGYYTYQTGTTQLGGSYSLTAGSNTPETGQYPFVGKVHALRFYTRKLTAAEILYNAHIDEARFAYGGSLHVLGFPDEYGTPSPAYGSSSPEESTLTFSPGPLTTYDDGAKAVPVEDGLRVKCLGYVLNGDFTTTNAIPTSALTLMDGMSVSWIWQRQYRIIATATAECPSVTLNGVTGTCVTNWVAEGASVTVVAAPTDATRCTAAWRHAPPSAIFSASDSTLTFAASGAASVVPWTAPKTSLRYWRGTTASANVAANWQDIDGANALPENGSTVILDATTAQSFTWNINDVTPGAWIQNGYSGTVTFQTGPGGTAKGVAQTVYGVLQDDGTTRALEVSGPILLNSGTWVHPAQPTFDSGESAMTTGVGVWRVIAHASGDFEIGSSVKIDLASLGFNSKQGPGTTSTYGGSHGGYASSDYSAHPCYGDATAPVTQGSSGWNGAVYNGCGAIELKAGGAMTLDGTLTTSGKNTGNYYGGAGGSVWITAKSLAGAGSIAAEGGVAPSGAPGAGGRIALRLTGEGEDFSKFTGTLSVAAGVAAATGQSAGTIYRETKAMDGKGELEVTGSGKMVSRLCYAGLAARDTEYHFSKITISKGARLGIMEGATVRADAVEGESSDLACLGLNGGTLILPMETVVTNCTLFVREPGSKILFDPGDGSAVTDTLHIGKGGVFTCDHPLWLGGLDLQDNAVMNHSSNAGDSYLCQATSRWVRIDLTVTGRVNIASSAKINLVECGARYMSGTPGTTVNFSASHGGAANGAAASTCFGSVTRPITWGAGGQYGNSSVWTGSWGGGAVKIIANDKLTLNGSILAHGSSFANVSYGTGAGGSVWLTASEIEGSGVINVNGGRTANGSSNGGGAGRVAIYLTKDGATLDAFRAAGGCISAVGGAYTALTGAGAQKGGAGTVFVSTISDGVTTGTLTIDNRGTSALTDVTAITPDVTDACVDDLIVTNGANLAVLANGKLQVSGKFDTHGRFTASAAGSASETAGTVEFVDASREAQIPQANEFQVFACNAPGKTIRFGTGDDALTTIAATGSLQLQGDTASADHVFLRSLTEGTPWLLLVTSGADTQIQYVDVKDSDAESPGGVAISAKDSKDSGNNRGWLLSTVVVGETNTWTGAADSSWGTAGNWDKNRAPEPTDAIVISGSAANMPVLAAAVTLDKLKIESGATLALGGYDLEVSNAFTVAGALVCSGSETLRVWKGPVSFRGGSFTAQSSTLVFCGTGHATCDTAGLSFYRLTMPTAGEVSFGDGFKTTYFTAEPSDALTLRFAAGRTVEVSEFVVHGVSLERPIQLYSTVEGTRWTAKVSRLESVYGVCVRDAAASGVKIYADAPSTSVGNNDENWVFGGSVAHWVGASGGNFSEANNWSTLAVPDALTRLAYEASATVTLDKPATVREIVGSGGTFTFNPGTNTLGVAGSLSLDSGATLSLNVPTVVSNSVMLRSGSVLTHAAMTAKGLAITNRIHLTVRGDMTVDAGAAINAQGKGFTHESSGGHGYGEYGASHGGVGTSGTPCHGSVFAPTHPGSTAASWDNGAGGGVVYLGVKGNLAINGTLSVNGSDAILYPPSGGSVWIEAGSFTGSGTISANASRRTGDPLGRTGGGRLAIYTTGGDFSGFTGRITAYGSSRWYEDSKTEEIGCSAGTIYLASLSAPKAGTLYLDGFRSELSGATAQLPAPGFEGDDPAVDFKKVKLVIRNGGNVTLSNDLTVRDVAISNCVYDKTAKPLSLNGHTLTVLDRTHRRGNGWVDGQGVKTGLPSGSVSTGEGGQILWPPRPLAILIR